MINAIAGTPQNLTDRKRLWGAIALVAVLQTLVLGWMIFERASLLASGREIVLDVVPVDPRSLFQGDYVVLGYDMSRISVPPGANFERGSLIYVTLQKAADGKFTVAGASQTPPTTTGPDQVVVKGQVQYVVASTDQAPAQANVQYGIETYFVPEGTGRELEKLVGERKLSAVIAVDTGGNAAIKGLMADGKPIYEEPLL
jgi:uncharacterized membrane-anchored protein